MTDSIGLAGSTRAAEPTIDLAFFGDLRELAETAGEDFLNEVVGQFVDETDARIVELRQAFELGDAAAAVRLAHGIKGSAAQLGGRRLAAACDRLEELALTADTAARGGGDLRAAELDYRELRQALTAQLSSPVDQPDRSPHA